MAHNANFDMTFLYLAYEDVLGIPLTNDFVDTLRVARKALPELGHHRAEDVCAAFGITNTRETLDELAESRSDLTDAEFVSVGQPVPTAQSRRQRARDSRAATRPIQ